MSAFSRASRSDAAVRPAPPRARTTLRYRSTQARRATARSPPIRRHPMPLLSDAGAGDAACAFAVTQSEPDTACANVVPADTTTFAAKITAAQPGDCIRARDGQLHVWCGDTLPRPDAPIVIRSQTLGGATVSAGTMTLTGSYAVIQGLTWTTPGAPSSSARVTTAASHGTRVHGDDGAHRLGRAPHRDDPVHAD